MTPSLFAPWHDFYALVGTAAATLVGLMFVAASVGTGVFTVERQVGLRTFLSPTVVAFSAVLAISLLGVMPGAERVLPATVVGGMGLLGLGYSWSVWRRMRHGGITASIDREDRVWYLVVPALAYLLLAVTGVMIGAGAAAASGMLAGVACLLLLAGLRNAWDMTTWIVIKRPG